MKSYGKIDFEGGGAGVKDLKIDSGDAFPTTEVEKGYLFWLNGVGPHVHTGNAWLPIPVGQQSHASLSGLTSTDDHTQYLHLNIARVILAQHTFAPDSAKAPFVLNANAQGQKVIGLNADLLDGYDSSAFVLANTLAKANGVATLDGTGHVASSQLLTLANGMPAYIEPVGNVLTSIASTSYAFLLASNGTRNAYLSIWGDVASNVKGFLMPRNALVRAAIVSASAALGSTNSASFQLRVNGSTTPAASFNIAGGSDRGIYTDQSIQLNAGDEIAAYLSASGNIANPAMVLEISWRN